MPITRGATLSSTKISANSTDGSISHTVDAGTDLLLVYVGMEGNESLAAPPDDVPSWSLGGGENLTLIQTFGASTNAADCIGQWYGLVSPTAGAGTVTITFASNVNPAITMAANYIDVVTTSVAAATNTLSTDVNDTGTSTSVHASAGTAGNALVVGGHFQGNDGATPTDNASFNDVFNDTTGDSSSADFTYFWGDILDASGATAVTITWQATDENTSGYIELVWNGDIDVDATGAAISGDSGTTTAYGWPKVYLNATQTTVGADEMTVTAANAAGTSCTFTDPSGGQTGSLQLGVENQSNSSIAWIAVTVNATGAVFLPYYPKRTNTLLRM
jgi:hypothetical protein